MSLAGFNGDTSYNGPSPSEYYGSMAAGSIVGASSRGARQGMSAQRSASDVHMKAPGRSQGNRRPRPASGEGKFPMTCRAQTVQRHEGWVHARSGGLKPEGPAAEAAEAPAVLERHWCTLTTNCFSAYTGPSKLRVVRVVPIRAVLAFRWRCEASVRTPVGDRGHGDASLLPPPCPACRAPPWRPAPP